MPFVHIEILEGVSDEKKQEIVTEMTNTFQRVVGIPEDKVFIFFEDLKKNNYAKQGKLVINHDT